MGITTTIPINLDFPNRGVLERDDFVLAQETAQDLLAGAYTTALNQYATELNDTEADINLKWEQVQSQAVVGSYSQAYIDATFTPKILNTQADKTTPVDADLIPLSDSASSFGLKKLSWANLKATLISSFGVLISSLTAKTTVVGNDLISIADSASANDSKKVTLNNLKTFVSPASSETVSGIIELATTAEAQAGTDDSRAITPLKLFNSLKGSNQNLSSGGYQKLHGGLIIQWGTYSGVLAHGSSYTPTFPITFPNACVKVVCQYGNTAVSTTSGPGFEKITQKLTNSFTFQWGWNSGVSAQVDVDYIAIGY